MTCSVPHCERPAQARGWCSTHYARWRLHGDLREEEPIVSQTTALARLLRHTDRRGDDECWPWLGALSHGYGMMREDGRTVGAHRVSYREFVGPIPDSLVIDHMCHNRVRETCRDGNACPHRRCVNPVHLLPSTQRQNSERGERALPRLETVTHCKQGHPLSGENLYVWRGHRSCRTCRVAAGQRHRRNN